MTYKAARGLWLYYKCSEKDLSIILLDYSINPDFIANSQKDIYILFIHLKELLRGALLKLLILYLYLSEPFLLLKVFCQIIFCLFPVKLPLRLKSCKLQLLHMIWTLSYHYHI